MVQPARWSPPIDLSPTEERLVRICKKAPLFVFLRRIRHELFDDAFQAQLAALYKASSRGQPPAPPALLAMAGLLQAATGVSDAEAVRLAATDRCWQMVLGTLDDDDPPFAQGTLAAFRARLIAADADRALLERSVTWARERGGYSDRKLRAAFDASPLWGAGRVEDTINLLGHAARDIVATLADVLGVTPAVAAQRAGIPLLTAPSVKAGLDIDWSDAAQKRAALTTLLDQVAALQRFVARECAAASAEAPLRDQLTTLADLLAQDLEPDPAGGQRIARGVARERRISVRDPEMRHGRKSKAVRVDGYKRHVARDHASALVVAAAVTPANRPEAEAAAPLCDAIERQGLELTALDVDRGYVLAPAITARRAAGLVVRCRALPLRNDGRYTKANFRLDFATRQVTCPAGVTVGFEPDTVVHFPRSRCGPCEQRERCTRSRHHRALTIHADEEFLAALRSTQATPAGRAELRERVAIEHSLARISQTQGDRARYLGTRKNLYDLRRHAAIANLYVEMGRAA